MALENVPAPVDGVDLFAGGGGSAGGGGGGGENYVPEDLISLLDAGINSDHPSVIIDADAMFSEEMFSYSGAGQQRATLARSSSSRYHIHMTRCSIIMLSFLSLQNRTQRVSIY